MAQTNAKTMIKTTVNTTKQILPNGQVIETVKTVKERVAADAVPLGAVCGPPVSSTPCPAVQQQPPLAASTPVAAPPFVHCPPQFPPGTQNPTSTPYGVYPMPPCATPLASSDPNRSTVTSKVSSFTMVDPATGQQRLVKRTTTTIHPVGSLGLPPTGTVSPCLTPSPMGPPPQPPQVINQSMPAQQQQYYYSAPSPAANQMIAQPTSMNYQQSNQPVRRIEQTTTMQQTPIMMGQQRAPPQNQRQPMRRAPTGPPQQQPQPKISTTNVVQQPSSSPAPNDNIPTPQASNNESERQKLEASIRAKLLERSRGTLGRVQVSGSSTTRIQPPTVMTKHGPEPALQQLTLERRVDRGPRAEIVTQHLTGIDTDQKSGQAKRIDINLQQYDPQHLLLTENQSVSVISSLTVSPSSKQIFKVVKKENTPIDEVGRVARLVDEESKEVEDTLRLLPKPPRLVAASAEAYVLERKQQEIRAQMGMRRADEPVEVRPPTADDAPKAPLPEHIAGIMHCFEKGLSPNLLPDQVFNRLYPADHGDVYVNVESVIPGPLADAVITADLVPKEPHLEAAAMAIRQPPGEMLSIPEASAYVDSGLEAPKPETKSVRRCSFRPVEEANPWWGQYKQRLNELIGAYQMADLEAVNVNSATAEDLSDYLDNGIEYFMEPEKSLYQTHAQIRGSQPPPEWFPGYHVALKDTPGVVQAVRSPSEAFYLAWKSVHPKNFPPDTIISI